MGWISTLLFVIATVILLSDVSQQVEVKAAMPAWASKYTKSSKGCPCWFDLSRGETDCACCHNKGIQCGYSMHKYCQRDARRSQYRTGCPGRNIYV